jgi:hypothetical protein
MCKSFSPLGDGGSEREQRHSIIPQVLFVVDTLQLSTGTLGKPTDETWHVVLFMYLTWTVLHGDWLVLSAMIAGRRRTLARRLSQEHGKSL